MFKPMPIKLKRGEAVFHHPLAVHGSLENKYGLVDDSADAAVDDDSAAADSADAAVDGDDG